MKASKAEASPLKAVLQELEFFRKTLRKTAQAYASRLDDEVSSIAERLGRQSTEEELTSSQLRDLRDILTHLRHIEVKPEKGRRKDLKKLDSAVGDLTMLTEKW